MGVPFCCLKQRQASMDDGADEAMMDKGPPKKKTRLSTWAAIIFVLGFGVALLGMTFVQWKKECDQPMKIFMGLHGVAGAFAAFFFLACEVMYLESKDPY